MGISKILSENSLFISDNKIQKTEIFVLGKSSYFNKFKLKDLLLRMFFDIKQSAKINVDHFDGDINFVNQRMLETGENILRVENILNINSYPPQFGVVIAFQEELGVRYGAGRSFESTEEALHKALGEYLERFYGYFSRKNTPLRFFKKPKQFSLKKSSLRLHQLARPLSIQKIHNDFPKEDRDLESLEAYDVFNGVKNKMESLPLQCLYLNVRQEKFLQHQTSSGSGGGVTEEDAKLSAVYELIERDHFLLFWLSGISPKQVEIQTLPNELREFIEKMINRYKLEVSVLDTSYDTEVFSCAVSIIDPVLHRVTVGSAAGTNAVIVISKALSEALTELHSSTTPDILSGSFSYETYEPFSDARITKDIRKDFYNLPGGSSLFKKILLNGEKIDFKHIDTLYSRKYNSKKEELAAVVRCFEELSKRNGDGYNLYFLKYEGPLLNKSNYFVYRAYVPSLIKIWLNELFATPWSERLDAFAKHHKKKSFSEKDVTMYPHPLA